MLIPRLGRRSARYTPCASMPRGSNPPPVFPTLLGHVGTIRADRRDADIMRRYAFATAREQDKTKAHEILLGIIRPDLARSNEEG